MGHENDRPFGTAQSAQDLHHVGRVLAVEGAGRFVGQQDLGFGHQSSSQRHPLLFATRQLHRPMIVAMGQTHPGEGSERSFTAFGRFHPSVQKRGLHVAERVEVRDEMELLEHETDTASADLRARGIGEGRDVDPVDHDASVGRGVETAEQTEQGRLPGTGGTDDRREVTRHDRDRHVVESFHQRVSGSVGPAHPGQLHERSRHDEATRPSVSMSTTTNSSPESPDTISTHSRSTRPMVTGVRVMVP